MTTKQATRRVVSFKIGADLLAQLDRVARGRSVTRSTVIREALARAVEDHDDGTPSR